MHQFLAEHPLLAGILIFSSTVLGVFLAVIALSVWVMSAGTVDCSTRLSDPCDGAPMLVMALWILYIPGSIFLGVIAIFIYYLVSPLKREKP
jgi:uncharacterized BrkB/YihY/UPF0761 family membrane protein